MRPAAALEAALRVLEDDQLATYTRIADALDGLTVICTVDGAKFTVTGGHRLLISEEACMAAAVEVAADRAAILDLIDGEFGLLHAVATRRLRVIAAPPLLLRIAQAARYFAEGAARARRVRPILEAFRAAG